MESIILNSIPQAHLFNDKVITTAADMLYKTIAEIQMKILYGYHFTFQVNALMNIP